MKVKVQVGPWKRWKGRREGGRSSEQKCRETALRGLDNEWRQNEAGKET